MAASSPTTSARGSRCCGAPPAPRALAPRQLLSAGAAAGATQLPRFGPPGTYHVEEVPLRRARFLVRRFSGNLTEGYREQDMAVIEPEYNEWRDAAAAPGAVGDLSAIGLTGRLAWIATMKSLVFSVITGVPAAVASSGLILCVFTANWRIAIIATATIIGVIASFFITFVLSGWTLGLYECMFLQLTAGMAVDYIVHLAHAYNECQVSPRPPSAVH